VIIDNFLRSVRLLSDACHGFVDYLLKGITLNRERIDYYLRNSLMLVTALTPRLGYDKAARVAQVAYQEEIGLREAAEKLGFLTGREFDELVRPETMTHPLEEKDEG
jgi:fumarate hydratase, class II